MKMQESAQAAKNVAKSVVVYAGEAALAFLGVYISGMALKNIVKSYLKSLKPTSDKE